MIYSRFDEELKLYRYYQGSDVAPSKRRTPNALGSIAADEAMPAVPLFATEIGTGEEAVGRIATAGVNWQQVFGWGVKLLAAYGLFKLIVR